MNFVRPEDVQNKYNMTSTSKQFPAPRHSGPVPNVMDPTLKHHPNSLYQQKPSLFGEDIRRDLVGHIYEKTSLNEVFFSSSNLELLHSRIQEQVFQMSGSKHRIDKQSDDDLKLIMRSYYLQYGKNLPDNINGQVNKLNNMVINWSSDEIITNIDQYMKYKETVSTLPMPLERSQLSSQKGTKTLEIKSFV